MDKKKEMSGCNGEEVNQSNIYFEKVVAEKTALDEKIIKLCATLKKGPHDFKGGPESFDLLRLQFEDMIAYSNDLNMRILKWGL